jgi:hypothetical protein
MVLNLMNRNKILYSYPDIHDTLPFHLACPF